MTPEQENLTLHIKVAALERTLRNLEEDVAGLKAAAKALAIERDQWKRRASAAEMVAGEELE